MGVLFLVLALERGASKARRVLEITLLAVGAGVLSNVAGPRLAAGTSYLALAIATILCNQFMYELTRARRRRG